MKKTLFFMLLLFTTSSFALKDGIYRLELSTQYAKIPFLIQSSAMGREFSIINGDEVIKLINLRTKKKNHVTLEIPTYQSHLSLDTTKDGLNGVFIRSNGSELKVSGRLEAELFMPSKLPPSNFNGKWEVIADKKESNILILEQDGLKIKGSYLTKYGDYRSFNGSVDGNNFSASSFDGVYNYLITGELKNNKLFAKILANYKIELEGKRNESVRPVDPYSLTKAEKKLVFTFPNFENKNISLNDKEFKGRPVIIQIFGSWCPNCIDELNYLIPWFDKNSKRGIDIIAISFERTNDLKRAQVILKKLADKHGLNYPMLIAGLSAEDSPEKKLPGLKDFMAFPTTIFLDKNHNVYKVHTGFNGPGTKEFHLEWQKDFNSTVDHLLK